MIALNRALAKTVVGASPIQENVCVVPAGPVYIVKINAARGRSDLTVQKNVLAISGKDVTMYQENVYHVQLALMGSSAKKLAHAHLMEQPYVCIPQVIESVSYKVLADFCATI